MSEPFGIALIGCGTVGSGVARLLLEQKQRLAARAGRPLQLRHVVVLNPEKDRPIPLPQDLLTGEITLHVSDLPRVRTGDRGVFFVTRSSEGRNVPHLRGLGIVPLDDGGRVPGTSLTLDMIRGMAPVSAVPR